MSLKLSKDYRALDLPEVCTRIFHPRSEVGGYASDDPGGNDHLIPVEKDVCIGLKFHINNADNANILFFHGNGEIAADYNDVAPQYHRIGANFIVADYRGYGRSDGNPTVTTMMDDCHRLFTYVEQWLKDRNNSGPLIVMGRSLGSASAYELAFSYPSRIDGLIIESGFAFAGPLLQLLGVDIHAIGFDEDTSFANLFKASAYRGPSLFIHAQYDEIIPYSDGTTLYEISPANSKQLLMIPGANHNDILIRGWDEYFAAIEQFLTELS